MWHSKGNTIKRGGYGNGLTAVAIDKDKGSQNALKWALENILLKGQTLVLIHVLHKSSSFAASNGIAYDGSAAGKDQYQKLVKDLFLSFRCFCTRKDVNCIDVALVGNDIAKAITEYASNAAIENLILAPSKHGLFKRFKADVPSTVSKTAPDFCTVYVISRGKISSIRKAIRPAPFASPLQDQIESLSIDEKASIAKCRSNLSSIGFHPETPRVTSHIPVGESFRGASGFNARIVPELMTSDSDISFVSSDRPSIDQSPFAYEFIDLGRTSQLSGSSATSLSMRSGPNFMSPRYHQDLSPTSVESGGMSYSGSAHTIDEMEAEMRRLKLELKQTMELYNTACKEALTANQKAREMDRWKTEEEKRLEEVRLSEDAAQAVMEEEKARRREALESAEAARRMAEQEAHRRMTLEIQARKEVEEMKKIMESLAQRDIRYRKYSIKDIEEATEFFSESRKIGEGGYGPVYKCYLDHTSVAVKVLRPDAAQGRSQFRKEIEVLSTIRHPNMVLLLGACPEYGILVYEYMAKGSLEDCLFRKGNTPALPWQIRFRIAAEIGTGLLFLHQNKPEPIVHRDLKPGNILLDSNYTSKISDVGLARLVPALADNLTQCHKTAAAGTFFYIDPEYQQTGLLGVKSDTYSLGILLLQLITAKPPMGLTHCVEEAIEEGSFRGILDPAIPDWPVDEALCLARLALKCSELKRKDRPDLGKQVLPELHRLREFAEKNFNYPYFAGNAFPSPNHSQVSMTLGMNSEQSVSSKSQSSTSSLTQAVTDTNSDTNSEAASGVDT